MPVGKPIGGKTGVVGTPIGRPPRPVVTVANGGKTAVAGATVAGMRPAGEGVKVPEVMGTDKEGRPPRTGVISPKGGKPSGLVAIPAWGVKTWPGVSKPARDGLGLTPLGREGNNTGWLDGTPGVAGTPPGVG